MVQYCLGLSQNDVLDVPQLGLSSCALDPVSNYWYVCITTCLLHTLCTVQVRGQMRVILEAYANRDVFVHASNTYKNELEVPKSIDTNINGSIVLQERGICLQIRTITRKCLYVNQVNTCRYCRESNSQHIPD